MLRAVKNILCGLAVVAAGVLPASAFSLMGPLAAYQTPALGYDGTPFGGPMNLTEEYRWTVPKITYAFDESFANYFGVKGMAEIDAAFQVFTDVPHVDTITTGSVGDPNLYGPDGNPIPITTRGINFQAQFLQLLDLKSTAMSAIIQQLGLQTPEFYVWTLRARATFNNGATTNYMVIQRNFDPVTFQYSSSINTTLYTYRVIEDINGADALEEQAGDPFSIGYFNTVAGAFVPANLQRRLPAGIGYGEFFSGLTRDDVGGLRYLYRTANVQKEPLRAGYTNSFSGQPYGPISFPVGGTNRAVINAVRGGIGKVSFQKVVFDSLLGTGGYTTEYDDRFSTNPAGVGFTTQKVRLVATNPDYLIAAGDLGVIFGGGGAIVGLAVMSTPGTATRFFNSTQVPNLFNLVADGPGTIGVDVTANLPDVLIFNKVGPGIINQTPEFVRENTGVRDYRWGSFDGSITPPTVYPDEVSIQQLEQLILNRP